MSSSVLERIGWRRVVIITFLAPALAFALIIIAALQGDSDLPPYNPPTAVDRFCSAGAAFVAWPAFAGTKLRANDGVVLLLFVSSGLCWAVLVEGFFLAKNAAKA